nr:MAG TPA: hypothetical protein [Caudoviricetes sp.]
MNNQRGRLAPFFITFLPAKKPINFIGYRQKVPIDYIYHT